MTHKIALITGGSRGLGKNAALKLASRGTDIILTYHSQQQLAQSVVREIEATGGRAVAIQLDTGNVSQFADFSAGVKRVLKEIWNRDSFDCLVNNAGIGPVKPFADVDENEFDRLMNIHLKGPFFLTQQLLPLIADGGRILNVSSGLTRIVLPGFSAYAAMKGAMEVLTRYQAQELGQRQITVNVIAPGATETDFGDGAVRDNQQMNAHIAAQTALGRAGLPDDIGNAIAVILSDEAGWVNAQRIEASGGQNI